MSEEREEGVREKGRHEVKRIHLGVGRGDPGHSRAVTGTREVTRLGQKKVEGRESPLPLRYRLGTLYAEGLPVGGLQMDLFTPAQRFPQIIHQDFWKGWECQEFQPHWNFRAPLGRGVGKGPVHPYPALLPPPLLKSPGWAGLGMQGCHCRLAPGNLRGTWECHGGVAVVGTEEEAKRIRVGWPP